MPRFWPRYLRFVRGLVDSADLPLNVSREMIQESPILAAIKRSVTGRVLGDLEKLADNDAAAYGKITRTLSGRVIKEGICDDFERRNALLALSRFKTTAGAARSLKDYIAGMKEKQAAIYYLGGDDLTRLEASPHLEGFRAAAVGGPAARRSGGQLLGHAGPRIRGQDLKSVTQGAADLAAIPRLDTKDEPSGRDRPGGR